MSYNILAVRKEDDSSTRLYPDLGSKGKAVALKPSVDLPTEHFTVPHVSVWERQSNEVHCIGSFGATHTVYVTKSRVICLAPDYKHADKSLLLFDLPGLYLASALKAKVITRHRALAGHVWYVNLTSLMVWESSSRKELNKVRLFVNEETSGQLRGLALQFALSKDPKPLFETIKGRVVDYWEMFRDKLSEAQRARVQQLRHTNWSLMNKDEWFGFMTPYSGVIGQDGKAVRANQEVLP